MHIFLLSNHTQKEQSFAILIHLSYRIYLSWSQILQNPASGTMYNGCMRKHSTNIHWITSPKISNSIILHNISKISKKLTISKGAIWCLDAKLCTTKRYLTLSTGAIKVLLRAPAIPPDIKLFAILWCSSSFLSECIIIVDSIIY